MANFYGYNPPFIGGVQNVLSRQEDERLIKNDILQLLLTIPGERVMRPTFGVNLRNFVFEQMIDSEVSALESEIFSQIENQEPRVTVELVTVTQSPDTNRIDISIQVRIKKDPTRLVTIETFLENPVAA